MNFPPHLEYQMTNKFSLGNVVTLDNLFSTSFNPNVALTFYIDGELGGGKLYLSCCLLKFKLPAYYPYIFIEGQVPCEEEILLPYIYQNKLTQFKIVTEEKKKVLYRGYDYDPHTEKCTYAIPVPVIITVNIKTLEPVLEAPIEIPPEDQIIKEKNFSPPLPPPLLANEEHIDFKKAQSALDKSLLFSTKSNSIDFKKAAQYALTMHLSKPYKFAYDEKVFINGQTIFRPNHGLAHAVRKIYYLDYVLPMYIKKNNDIDANYLQSNLDMIKLGLLFGVTGREGEEGFKDGPNYEKYRIASTRNFMNYTQNILQLPINKIINQVADSIGPAGGYIRKCNGDDTSCHIKNIMAIAHTLDMMRVDNIQKFQGRLNEIINLNLISQNDLNMLLDLARYLLQITGDKILASNNPIFDYQPVFANASTNVTSVFMMMIEGVNIWSNKYGMTALP